MDQEAERVWDGKWNIIRPTLNDSSHQLGHIECITAVFTVQLALEMMRLEISKEVWDCCGKPKVQRLGDQEGLIQAIEKGRMRNVYQVRENSQPHKLPLRILEWGSRTTHWEAHGECAEAARVDDCIEYCARRDAEGSLVAERGCEFEIHWHLMSWYWRWRRERLKRLSLLSCILRGPNALCALFINPIKFTYL